MSESPLDNNRAVNGIIGIAFWPWRQIAGVAIAVIGIFLVVWGFYLTSFGSVFAYVPIVGTGIMLCGFKLLANEKAGDAKEAQK